MGFRIRQFLLTALVFLLTAAGGRAAVYISEFMADNDGVLIDSDGDTPDWVELHNTDSSSIDLTGWYLTDSTTNLTQWTFPATNIPPEGYLIVFASGKNRTTSGAELHTNFKLSAYGETIALVAPDGTSIEDLHVFPELPEDISFGYSFAGSTENTVTLDSGAPCTAHIPTSASDAAGWQLPAFDDLSWLSGTTGVGYENNSGYQNLIGLDVLAMRNTNPTVYIRVPFGVTNAAAINSLLLKMKYDDGFVAYLNGVQVASANISGTPAWNSTCTDHLDSLAVVFGEFDLTPFAGLLNEGSNLLAIHGLNQSISSSDLLFIPRIEVGYAGQMDPASSGLLASPSPGAANTDNAYDGFAETPTASPDRGFFYSSFQVVLSNRTAGATIRYTLDGSEPDLSSTEYTGPIDISSTTTLRTRAFLDGWKPSFSSTHTYLFLDNVIAEPRSQVYINNNPIITGMDSGVLGKTYHDASNEVCTVREALLSIPTLSVVTDNDNLFGTSNGIYVNPAQRWERAASVELINPDGSEGFQINAGLRIRGGWSRHNGYAKHALRLLFKKEYGNGKLRYPLFGDEGADAFDNMDLRTAMNYNWTLPVDAQERNTFLRDVFSRDTAGAMHSAYTRSRYYHLYLNGHYWGLYMTEERPEASYAASYFGGDPADYDVIKSTSWLDSPSYVAEATDGTMDAYNRLYAAAMAGFTDNADYFAVQGLGPDGQPDAAEEKLLDVDNLIDYLLLIYYTGASDNGITVFIGNKLNNLYAIYNREDPDGFKWIQHDCEHSLDTSTQLDRTGPFYDSHLSEVQYFNAQTLHEKLLDNTEYRIAFADRVYRHLTDGGALTRSNSEARFDLRKAQIDRAIIANAARWGSTSLDRDTWINAVSSARNFFNGRESSVLTYLNADELLPSINPPQISPSTGLVASGTQVSITAASGTVYYTTDGSDPRAIGGSVSGTAYTTPITISAPNKVKARARTAGGEWSAMREAVYWTADVPLAVTELMYHAPAGNTQDFIEIRNISDSPVSLYGYKLDRAVDFKFRDSSIPELAPGEFLVAIKDIDGFYSAHGTNGILIAGEYRGDFDNSGEKVELEFWNHDLITFRYSDARNWPQAADGGGHSLVPLDSAVSREESGVLNHGGNWRASTYIGGSPGYADPVPAVTVMINEITAHTDTGEAPPFESNDRIELYNPAPFAVVLTGWTLSDDVSNPAKWAIPDGTTIPAFGFVQFDEDDFHPDRISGFGLDKAGESVVLSAPGRIADAVRFKGQENGVSYGRYPDGSEHWMTTQLTPEAPNQPLENSIRISELMYNPPAPAGYASGDAMEYVQLQNPADAAVDFQTPAGSWRIDGGISYTFPADFNLPANSRAWLVSFDPDDTGLLNLFCSTYGLNASEEIILGPYSGHLSNEGERVAVERPQDSDDPLRPLDISWVVVDELYYFNQRPWPEEADGSGYPLVRTGLTEWGVQIPTDTDADELTDSWEQAFFGSLDEGKYEDWDQDGFCNLEEQICGTDPTNALSYFAVTELEAPVIHWTAVEGRTYSVYWSDDLNSPFIRIATDLAYPQDSYSDSLHTTNECNFYYIVVEQQ